METEKKGQGALEYLLLIGGAVLIAVIVITLVLGLGNVSQYNTENTSAKGFCEQEATIDPQKFCGGDDHRIQIAGNISYCCGMVKVDDIYVPAKTGYCSPGGRYVYDPEVPSPDCIDPATYGLT